VRTLFGEAFEYQQTVPFFALFMATLRADPPIGDADALRRLGGSADLRYWVCRICRARFMPRRRRRRWRLCWRTSTGPITPRCWPLRSLASTRPDVPVLWVLTARTGAGGPLLQETLSVLQRADAAFVRVAAMSASAVADMVCDAVRANADASLLNLAAKAHGNPFLVRELVGGLDEEGRLNVSGGRAVATGHALPRRLGASMQQRLDHLSAEAKRGGAGGRGAAGPVLGWSAGRDAGTPAGVVDGRLVDEAVRADLLVEDGEQLRFRHDLLRETTLHSLPQSLRRAMERQIGIDHAEYGRGAGRGGHPAGTQRRARRQGGDQRAPPGRAISGPQ